MTLKERLRKLAAEHIDQFGRHPNSDTMLEAASALEGGGMSKSEIASQIAAISIPGLKPITKKEA
jgi:hypothetical protein